MPTYNGEKWVGEAIRSILSQTYQPYEIIISDDCSTDNTLKTIKNKYGVSTKNIRGWNNIASNAPLKKGQQLVIWKTIKQPVSYTVKPGDSLSLIAHRHNTKINQILDLNPGVKRHKALKVGQRLLVG